MNFLKNRLLWIFRGEDGASAIFQTIASRILILALNIGTGIITARALGPGGRGEQAAIVLWSSVLPYLATLGLPAALIYSIRREPERQGEILGAVFILGGMLSLGAVGIGFVGIPYWLSNYSEQTVTYARWLLFGTPLSLIVLLMSCAAETLGNFSLSNQMRLFPPVVSLFLLLGLIWQEEMSPFTAALAMTLPTVPVFFIVATALLKTVKLELKNIAKNSIQLLHYGIRAYGIDVVNTLAGRVDQIFIVGLLSGEALGIYVVSTSISRMLNTIQNAIVTVLLPKITGKTKENIESLSSLVFKVFWWIGGGLAILIGLLAPVLLSWFYGDDFMTAIPAMRILLLEAWVASLGGILSQIFLAMGRPGFLTIIQGSSLGIAALFLTFSVPSFGLIGACFSLLAADVVKLILIITGLRFILDMSAPNILISRSDIKSLNQRIIQTIAPAT